MNIVDRSVRTLDGEAIMSAVSKFGCLLDTQSVYFIRQLDTRDNLYHAKAVCLHLQKTGQFCYSGNFVTRKGFNIDLALVDALWVAIDVLYSSDTEDVVDDMKTIVSLQAPEGISFIVNHQNIVRVVGVENVNDVAKLALIQDKIINQFNIKVGEEYKIPFTYIFAVRDPSLNSKIAGLQLSIPHKVAILDGDILQRPHIEYFEKQ